MDDVQHHSLVEVLCFMDKYLEKYEKNLSKDSVKTLGSLIEDALVSVSFKGQFTKVKTEIIVLAFGTMADASIKKVLADVNNGKAVTKNDVKICLDFIFVDLLRKYLISKKKEKPS